MFNLLPWQAFTGDRTHFWVHYGLVIVGVVLAGITVVVQWFQPAPYGKHERQDANWGPKISQRLGHILSDAIPGVILFILIFFLVGKQKGYINIIFLIMFQAHYLHRGIIHPLIMRYRSKKVALGITLGGLFPNCLFHGLNADWIGSAKYDSNYYYDPRFIIGIILFIIGYIINRYADLTLRSLRSNTSGNQGYYMPTGCLFELVTCPNYLGELIEWMGWALATWSLAGLAWLLFSAATFFPRARHNHQWYKQQFEHYPSTRRALIPFLF